MALIVFASSSVLAVSTSEPPRIYILIPAIISAIASVISAYVASRNRQGIQSTIDKVEASGDRVRSVHDLLDSYGMASVEALAEQTKALRTMTEKRDDLVEEREAKHSDSPIDVNIMPRKSHD